MTAATVAQDAALDVQRRQETLDQTADRAAAAMQRSIADFRSRTSTAPGAAGRCGHPEMDGSGCDAAAGFGPPSASPKANRPRQRAPCRALPTDSRPAGLTLGSAPR